MQRRPVKTSVNFYIVHQLNESALWGYIVVLHFMKEILEIKWLQSFKYGGEICFLIITLFIKVYVAVFFLVFITASF